MNPITYTKEQTVEWLREPQRTYSCHNTNVPKKRVRFLGSFSVLLLFFAFAPMAHAAISFDVYGNVRGTAPTATLNLTLTGSNLALVATVSSPTGVLPSSCFWNAIEAMTQIDTKDNGSNQTGTDFLLINPTSGAHSIVCTSTGVSFLYISGADYAGVKQTGQPAGHTFTYVSTTGTTNSVTLGGLTDNVTYDTYDKSIAFGILLNAVSGRDWLIMPMETHGPSTIAAGTNTISRGNDLDIVTAILDSNNTAPLGGFFKYLFPLL